MSNKIALFLFTTAVLMASYFVMTIPAASALTARTDFFDNHTTARFGNSPVCGDHMCAPGEHDKWVKALNDAQRGYQAGHAKGAQHGEDVMHQLAGAMQGAAVQGSQNTGNMTGSNMPSGMG